MSLPNAITESAIGASDASVQAPPADHIDVRDHGAKLDGSTDDHSAIQSALDEAAKDGTPSAVYIPKGTAHIGSRLIIGSRHSGVTLQGAGSDTHLRLRSGVSQNYDLIRILGRNGAVTDVTIRDLRLDGQGDLQNDKHIWGVLAYASGGGDDNNLVENVWVHDFSGSNMLLRSPGMTARYISSWGAKNWHGVNIDCDDVDNSSRPITLEYCHAWSNTTHGIDASGGHSVVRHALSEENGWGGKNTSETLSARWENVVFQNNEYLGYMTSGGPQGPVTMNRVMARGNGRTGFYLQGGAPRLEIGEMVALGNQKEHNMGNIYISDGFSVTADSIRSGSAVNGPGIRLETGASGSLREYVHDGQNSSGDIVNGSDISVESTTQGPVDPLPLPTNPDSTVSDGGDTTLPHLLVVDGSNVTDPLNYELTVSGELEKTDEVGTINVYDTVEGSTVNGWVTETVDGFRFSGEITDVTFDRAPQYLKIFVDGEEVSIAELTESTLTIQPADTTHDQDAPIEFFVRTSGSITADTTESVTLFENDTVAIGFSYWWPTEFRFQGDLIEAHVPSNATVVLDGTETSPSNV